MRCWAFPLREAPMQTPPRDLTIFGATSFVGQILTRYLAEQFGTHGSLQWAIAGRSEAKLAALRTSLGLQVGKLPLVVADAADGAALRRMCHDTRVVISTVGPYALYGSPLVEACAETGTDYCDLTGEVQWIRRMIDAHEAAARKSGARIVHCCGFDSIPSDLGVWFLQQQAHERFGQPCTEVKMRVRGVRGGFSGGTVASLLNAVKEASTNPALRKQLADPYSICPEGYAPKVRQPDVKAPQFDADFGAWVAPFVMSAVNTRVVQRSNALSKQAYGADFRYDEAMLAGKGLKGRATAFGLTAGLAGFMVASALPPTRWVLERFVLPAPGEGPSAEQQRNGFFDLRFLGKAADGRTLRVKVTGDRDPGYGSTAKMLGQAGACLALDLADSGRKGGFWTPATMFGEPLVERLVAHAGITFEVMDD
jgi:short subunit dehydrogenase-like uncharacterized protein